MSESAKTPQRPKDFQDASWRATTTAFEKCDCPFGISFNVEGGAPVRLLIDERSALHVIATLADAIALYRKRTNSQSASSSGNPQVDGSMPVEGQQV